MKESLRQLLREATRLTRAGHLREATAAIQRALRPGAKPIAPPAMQTGDAEVIDIEARVVDAGPPPAQPAGRAEPPEAAPAHEPPARPLEPAQHAAPLAVEDTALAPAAVPGPDMRPGEEALAPESVPLHGEAPPGAFLGGSFTAAAGTRSYKLFVPGASAVSPRPLLVLLHGCKQNPDDFAAGTRMNELAQAQGWVVLYPAQVHSANGSGCWNWFQVADQQRGRGEPAILAGMTRHIIATEAIDPRRVYVAGLSAGGAMAATLAATYPELFAAVGIHSGLPHGAANDLMSALTAMRRGPSGAAAVAALPAIVFHGDGDRTVHPSNGKALIAQARPAAVPGLPTRVETGQVPGGHAYTRSIQLDAAGRPRAEHWLVHGAGHAWSGGSAAGSYTDPKGPDASAEMLRFFAGYRVADDAAAKAA